jgi:hypothetical protein
MRDILATLVLAVLIVALAVYDLVRGLYFYLATGISVLILSVTSKRREK